MAVPCDEEVTVTSTVPNAGLASELLRRHLRRLAALGVARVFLEVEQGNRPALKLYDRAGFSRVGERKGYYPRPAGAAAALVLRRDLA